MKSISIIFMLALTAAVITPMVGKQAPAFSRTDINGETVNLESYRGDKNVLLVFSRYIGCSWCQMFIVDLMQNAQAFADANTEVVIITTSDEETAKLYKPPDEFPFIIIPDPDMELYKLYGVKMKASSFTWNVFKQSVLFLKYLPRYDWVKNGLAGDHYQPPACFVIDAAGIIRYSHIGKDVADNPDVAEIIKALESL